MKTNLTINALKPTHCWTCLDWLDICVASQGSIILEGIVVAMATLCWWSWYQGSEQCCNRQLCILLWLPNHVTHAALVKRVFSVFMVAVLPCAAALVDLRDVGLNASMIDTCSFWFCYARTFTFIQNVTPNQALIWHWSISRADGFQNRD